MPTHRTYLPRSWVDPRVELRPSAIDGVGMFARAPIAAGEVVVIWGGEVWRREDATPDRVRTGSLAVIDEGHYLGYRLGSPATHDEYLNHSCDPTIWMDGDVTMTARLPIPAGGEVTADMAMHQYEDYVLIDACTCGSPLCRGVISGDDWTRPDLQARYAGHFCTFLNRKIAERQRPR